jgi:hypothetical protein
MNDLTFGYLKDFELCINNNDLHYFSFKQSNNFFTEDEALFFNQTNAKRAFILIKFHSLFFSEHNSSFKDVHDREYDLKLIEDLDSIYRMLPEFYFNNLTKINRDTHIAHSLEVCSSVRVLEEIKNDARIPKDQADSLNLKFNNYSKLQKLIVDLELIARKVFDSFSDSPEKAVLKTKHSVFIDVDNLIL